MKRRTLYDWLVGRQSAQATAGSLFGSCGNDPWHPRATTCFPPRPFVAAMSKLGRRSIACVMIVLATLFGAVATGVCIVWMAATGSAAGAGYAMKAFASGIGTSQLTSAANVDDAAERTGTFLFLLSLPCLCMCAKCTRGKCFACMCCFVCAYGAAMFYVVALAAIEGTVILAKMGPESSLDCPETWQPGSHLTAPCAEYAYVCLGWERTLDLTAPPEIVALCSDQNQFVGTVRLLGLVVGAFALLIGLSSMSYLVRAARRSCQCCASNNCVTFGMLFAPHSSSTLTLIAPVALSSTPPPPPLSPPQCLLPVWSRSFVNNLQVADIEGVHKPPKPMALLPSTLIFSTVPRAVFSAMDIMAFFSLVESTRTAWWPVFFALCIVSPNLAVAVCGTMRGQWLRATLGALGLESVDTIVRLAAVRNSADTAAVLHVRLIQKESDLFRMLGSRVRATFQCYMFLYTYLDRGDVHMFFGFQLVSFLGSCFMLTRTLAVARQEHDFVAVNVLPMGERPKFALVERALFLLWAVGEGMVQIGGLGMYFVADKLGATAFLGLEIALRGACYLLDVWARQPQHSNLNSTEKSAKGYDRKSAAGAVLCGNVGLVILSCWALGAAYIAVGNVPVDRVAVLLSFATVLTMMSAWHVFGALWYSAFAVMVYAAGVTDMEDAKQAKSSRVRAVTVGGVELPVVAFKIGGQGKSLQPAGRPSNDSGPATTQPAREKRAGV